MAQYTKPITIDIGSKQQAKIDAMQYDVKSRYIAISLIDNGLPFNLTGNTVRIYAEKKDGTIIFNDATLVDATLGKIKIELTSQMLAVGGILQCQLVINGIDSSVLRSKIFLLEVQNSIANDGAIQSTNEFTALANGLASLQEYNNYKNEIATARKGEVSLGAKVDKIDSSLADSMQQNKNVQHSKRRPLVTFVSDDGLAADITILKPIFLSYNVPCVTALITSQLNNVAERLDLQNNHGWEIASHGINHVYLDGLSESDLEVELKQSKQVLESAGFKLNSIVYPFGVHNESVRRVSKKYYKLGAEMGKYPVNKGVIPSFAIARTGLGCIFDAVANSNTLEYYKSKVDEAIANNGWCVFMLHSGNTDFNATQQGYLTQTIEYIQSLSVDIVTLNEGYEIFGNALEVGDYMPNNTDGFAYSKTGEIGNKISKLIKNTGLNNASLVTAFPAYCVSMTSFLNADSGGFPTSAGTLITSRLNAIEDISYQEWYPYDDTKKYKRIWSGSSWQPWTNEDGYKVMLNTGLNNASLISAFPRYRVSSTTYLNADNGGFPTSAGTLITSRINSNDALAYQLWMPYDSNTVYKRIWVTSAWATWQIIASVPTSWVGIVSTSTNWTKIGNFTITNYIDFATYYSSSGAQPTLSKKTWALSEISSDNTTPTVIGTIGAINIQTYKDVNGAIYIKYSTVGNNYPSFFNIAFC